MRSWISSYKVHALAFIGPSGLDAAMIAYNAKQANMQKVIVTRNVAVSADSFDEVYDIEQHGLKLKLQVQPLNEIIYASASQRALLTYG